MGSEEQLHISSSSDEEDGDDAWKTAINAVAAEYLGCSKPNQTSIVEDEDEDAKALQPQPFKHYQIKAQKVLDDLLTKSLVMVQSSDSVNGNAVGDHPDANEGGVRLFKQAPVGIVFDHTDAHNGPKKKPRILPGEEINEKSKKFKRRLQSVVVEGTEVLATANYACQKSRSRLEAKEAAARDAAKREEERVAQLKKIRGERWLPSMAREMQTKSKIR